VSTFTEGGLILVKLSKVSLSLSFSNEEVLH
jgi:hypothetical protein